MNHEYEHGHAAPAAADAAAAQSHTTEPGRASHSAALRRPEHPVASGLVQRKARDLSLAAPDIHGIADRGLSGPAGALPYLEAIQQAFGPEHDLSGVRSHVGGPAAEAAAEMGALAYATGDQVAFAEAPSLHTAAHEAAHVVQQRAGVHLKRGVGEIGDRYESHADAVADAVVRGESARGLLGAFTGGRGSQSDVVQRAPAPRAGQYGGAAHAQRATAGPSADDRGQVEARDFQTRLVGVADVGSGCQILIAGGSQRGLSAGMAGYVKAGASLLVEFLLAAVHDSMSTALLDMPADAVRGCHEVVLNPTSKPGTAKDIQGQITEVERSSGGLRLVISAGAPAGVRAGMTAYMHEHESALPFKRFVIDAVHGDTCQAFVQLPNDDLARSYAQIVINPSSGAPHAHPAAVTAANDGERPGPGGAVAAHHPRLPGGRQP